MWQLDCIVGTSNIKILNKILKMGLYFTICENVQIWLNSPTTYSGFGEEEQ